MNCFTGRSEALQQIRQLPFDVLFVASQALLSLSDSSKREQNQQWFVRRALPVCPPKFHVPEFLKKFVPFHGVSDVAYLLLAKVWAFAALSLAHLSGLIQYNQGSLNHLRLP